MGVLPKAGYKHLANAIGELVVRGLNECVLHGDLYALHHGGLKVEQCEVFVHHGGVVGSLLVDTYQFAEIEGGVVGSLSGGGVDLCSIGELLAIGKGLGKCRDGLEIGSD